MLWLKCNWINLLHVNSISIQHNIGKPNDTARFFFSSFFSFACLFFLWCLKASKVYSQIITPETTFSLLHSKMVPENSCHSWTNQIQNKNRSLAFPCATDSWSFTLSKFLLVHMIITFVEVLVSKIIVKQLSVAWQKSYRT